MTDVTTIHQPVLLRECVDLVVRGCVTSIRMSSGASWE